MQSDTIKLFASYGTAVVTAIGGSILLVFVWLQPADESSKAGIMALLGGFVGGSFTFLFTGNAGTAAVRTYQSGVRDATPTPTPTD